MSESRTKPQPPPARGPLPPTVFLASLAAMGILAVVFPGPRAVPWPWNLSGAILLALGAVLNLWADRQFKDASTTVKPFEASTRLVTGGAFRFSRNPMYAGMVAALAGVALLLQALAPWIIIPAFAVVVDRRFIRQEERMLEARFGDEWHAYRRRVRRWV